MQDIIDFKNQTNDIFLTTNKLSELLEQTLLSNEALTVQGLLTDLSQKLNEHLNTEKSDLMPEIISTGDETVRNLTNQCITDLDSLNNDFNTLVMKWDDLTAIQNNPTTFITETKSVINHLNDRMNIEKNELLPLYDKLNF